MAKTFKKGVSVKNGKVSISSGANVSAATRKAVSNYNSGSSSSSGSSTKAPTTAGKTIQQKDYDAAVAKFGKAKVDQTLAKNGISFTGSGETTGGKSIQQKDYDAAVAKFGKAKVDQTLAKNGISFSASGTTGATSDIANALNKKDTVVTTGNKNLATPEGKAATLAKIQAQIAKSGKTEQQIFDSLDQAGQEKYNTKMLQLGGKALDASKKEADETPAPTTLNKTDSWTNLAKENNPAKIAEFLNKQGNFDVKVEGDKIVGTKDGEKKEWIFKNGDWTAKDVGQSEIENPVVSDLVSEMENLAEMKADELNAPLKDTIGKLEDNYNEMEETARDQIKDQWNDIGTYENDIKGQIEAITNLAKQQYESYADNLARKISGRKAGISGQLSAEGFDPSVIGNLVAQVDEQYADERLKAQASLQDSLSKALGQYETLYSNLNSRKANLTQTEINFMDNLKNRINDINTLAEKVAANDASIFAPQESVNAALLESATGVNASDATNKAYEAQWKAGSEEEKITQLRSQLVNFLKSFTNADGSQKYDPNTISSDQLREFAKLGTSAEAYSKAVDFITQGKEKDTSRSGGTGGTGSGGGGTGSGSAGGGATGGGTTTPGNAPASASDAANKLEKAKQAAKKQAADLQKAGGFSKTTMSYNDYVNEINNAKDEAGLANTLTKVQAAVKATPEVGKAADIKTYQAKALNRMNTLTEEERAVLYAHPMWSRVNEIIEKIETYKPREDNIFTASDENRLKFAGATLTRAIDQILKGGLRYK